MSIDRVEVGRAVNSTNKYAGDGLDLLKNE